MDWIFLAELSVNGALTGLLYSLFAIGLVLVYKSSSVPNLAQGALTMLGAYVVLAFSIQLGVPLWVAPPSRYRLRSSSCSSSDSGSRRWRCAVLRAVQS